MNILLLGPSHGKPEEKFRFENAPVPKAKPIPPTVTNFRCRIFNLGVDNHLMGVSGNQAVLKTCHNTDDEIFHIQSNFTIQHVKTGLVLDVQNGIQPGHLVVLDKSNGSYTQYMSVNALDTRIEVFNSQYCLDLRDEGKSSDGTPVVVYGSISGINTQSWQIFPIRPPPSNDNINHAIAWMQKNFPSDAHNIASQKNIHNDVINSKSKVIVSHSTASKPKGPTMCVLAIIGFLADCLDLVLGLKGLKHSSREFLMDIIHSKLPETFLTGLRKIIGKIDIHSPKSLAIGIKDVIEQFWNFGTAALQIIFDDLKKSLAWYDWLVVGLNILAQFIADVASDGLALVAELVIICIAVPSIVGDISDIKTYCG